ncbi:hypothetical protein FCM35_KLT16379 [Carex littledalei]|uniref:Uncharacterized protein n=1 Tax=Carex littledalei TaxID=544730 RepID=A0A833VWX6_9POAL|nr:hypothetical protein FCM35_KLT16379 [Carex littledalei]
MLSRSITLLLENPKSKNPSLPLFALSAPDPILSVAPSLPKKVNSLAFHQTVGKFSSKSTRRRRPAIREAAPDTESDYDTSLLLEETICWLKKQKDVLSPEIVSSGNHFMWTSGLVFAKGEGYFGLETSHGTLRIKLFPDCAPRSVAYITKLLGARSCAGCSIVRAEDQGQSWDSKGDHRGQSAKWHLTQSRRKFLVSNIYVQFLKLELLEEGESFRSKV